MPFLYSLCPSVNVQDDLVSAYSIPCEETHETFFFSYTDYSTALPLTCSQ